MTAACQPGAKPRHNAEWAAPPIPAYATSDSPFEPLPREIDFDARAAQLGESLYADPIMSSDRSLTCFSCHDFDKGGTDGLPTPRVPSRGPAKLNTGTIFNLAFNFRFNWNGKYPTLMSHVNGPVTGELVMAMSWDELTDRVRSVARYRREFDAVYFDGVTSDNISHAVASYQRSLFTPNARFDRYLRGDADALDAHELEGLALFKSLGCVSCHQGINVGGNMFAKFGVIGDYFSDRARAGLGDIDKSDYGRFTVTQREQDKFVFRVPSLRNVACTGPYFHDGSRRELADVVALMGQYQLGRTLTAHQIARLVAFLRTMTGEYRGRPLCGAPDSVL